MLVILLVTFIVFKIKAPVLPFAGDEDHKRFSLVGIIFCSVGITWFALHVFFSYFVALRKVEIFLVHQNTVAIVNSVIVPSYFIYTLPNLRKYFIECLENHIISPVCNALNSMLNYLKSFMPTPRVDVLEE